MSGPSNQTVFVSRMRALAEEKEWIASTPRARQTKNKARIQKYTGTLNNYVRYLTATGALANQPTILSPAQVARNDAYAAIDSWMTAVLADTSNKSKAEKIAANDVPEILMGKKSHLPRPGRHDRRLPFSRRVRRAP